MLVDSGQLGSIRHKHIVRRRWSVEQIFKGGDIGAANVGGTGGANSGANADQMFFVFI